MIDIDKTCRFFQKVVKERSGRIAVYGVGEYAKILAKFMPAYIFCFCDGKMESGYFADKPVLPLTSLPDAGVQTVVIAAGSAAERIVFERIIPFCKQEGIMVYGVQSGNLSKAGQELSIGFGGEKAREQLWAAIESHEVISFDIFDTILMRKTLYPMDVFDIVEYRAGKAGLSLLSGFRNYRNQAEVVHEREATGLDGIYANIKKMLGMTDEEISFLKDLEMEVERDVLLPRPSIVEAGKYAMSLGKKVVLVSDMYLPPAFLNKVLHENGINFYSKIYVSDYYGTSKGQKLFDIVLRENPADTYLHIGDNPDADGWGARRKGIDSFIIKSALDIFRASGASHSFKYLDSCNKRLLLGLFLARAYADPFMIDEMGRRLVKDIKDFAGLFIAPISTSFVYWLLDKVSEQDFEAVLFAARDGYAFRKMYDEAVSAWTLHDVPPSAYLYLSRKLCLGLAMKEIQDLEWMRSKLQGKTRKFVNNVFQLGISLPEERDDDSDAVWDQVLSKKEDIYSRSAERKSRYRAYLRKAGLHTEGKYAFVDMCSQGTSQSSLFGNVLTNLYGLYFKRYNSKDTRTMGRVESFLPQDSHIMRLNNVFELIFSSPEPSVNDVDESGIIIFNEEVRSEEEIEESGEAQAVIMEFWRDFLNLAKPREAIGSMTGQQILELYKNGSFQGGIEVFTGRAISDDLEGGRLPV